MQRAIYSPQLDINAHPTAISIHIYRYCTNIAWTKKSIRGVAQGIEKPLIEFAATKILEAWEGAKEDDARSVFETRLILPIGKRRKEAHKHTQWRAFLAGFGASRAFHICNRERSSRSNETLIRRAWERLTASQSALFGKCYRQADLVADVYILGRITVPSFSFN